MPPLPPLPRARLARLAGHIATAAAATPSAPEPLDALTHIPPNITEAHSLPISPELAAVGGGRLSAPQVAAFEADGYLNGLPLLAPEAVPRLQERTLAMFEELERVAPGSRVDAVNMWQKSSRFCESCWLARSPAHSSRVPRERSERVHRRLQATSCRDTR